jgi:hypothetical protein
MNETKLGKIISVNQQIQIQRALKHRNQQATEDVIEKRQGNLNNQI